MKKITRPVRSVVVATVFMGLLGGCANMSDSQKDTTKRTLTGTAIGAAAGALIDSKHGEGALVGAAVGAVSGWLYDKHKKKQEETY